MLIIRRFCFIKRKKIRGIIKYLFAVLLLFACDSGKKAEFKSSYKDFYREDVSFDNINIRNFNYLTAKVFNDSDNEYLLFLNREDNRVLIYLQDSFQLFFESTFNFSGEEIIDISPISLDEIYLLSRNKKIIKTDTSFKAKEIFEITFQSSEWEGGYDICSGSYGTDFRVVDSVAYFDHYPLFVIKNSKVAKYYFTKRLGVGVNIYDTTQPITYSSCYPSNYRKQHFHDYHIYRIIANNLEIASFRACDTVFIRDIKTQNEYTKVLKSIKAKEFVWIDFDSSFDRYYLTKQFTEHFTYSKLFYGKYKNRYYRSVYHGVPFEKPDGTVSNPRDAQKSLIVTDKDFNIIDEIDFDNKYIVGNSIPTKKGLLILKNCDENFKNSVREKIVFSLFDI